MLTINQLPPSLAGATNILGQPLGVARPSASSEELADRANGPAIDGVRVDLGEIPADHGPRRPLDAEGGLGCEKQRSVTADQAKDV